jgi:hypothetical protein
VLYSFPTSTSLSQINFSKKMQHPAKFQIDMIFDIVYNVKILQPAILSGFHKLHLLKENITT